MARRRFARRRFRRRRRTAKPWYAKKYSVGDMASMALKGVNYIKGLVNAEVYKFDFTNSFSQTTSGNINDITGIAQGDGIATRTGNSIFIRSVDVNGTVTYNSVGTAGQVVRIYMLIDLQQVADTAPTWATVFDGSDVNAHLNENTVGRFKILMKRTFVVSANRPVAMIKMRKLMRHHIRFNGTASSDAQKGTIYLTYVSNQATNGPTIAYESRVSYHDN